MLSISNLRAEVDGNEILKGLTLEVPSGEVHAIMGPNGAGKSTLSYVLTGREGYEVTGGTATLNGEDLLSLDAALTQLAALDEHLAQVVELRYFAGLSEAQIAELTERSERSVRRDWQKARMFLLDALQGR